MKSDEANERGSSPESQDDREPGRIYFPPVTTGISSVSGASPGGVGISPLLFEPAETGLVEQADSDDMIPPAPLLAMEDRLHSRRLYEADEPGHVQRRLGEADAAVYFIDDGRDHCMIGRRVGQAPDGSTYCLVGRISIYWYQELARGDAPREEVFSEARDISLCAVFVEGHGASNVAPVQHYKSVDDVPGEYLPPAPFLEFTDEELPDLQ
jgi:hypothetical protein